MSAVDRRFTLHIDDEIEQDIYDVFQDDEGKGAALVALIEELKDDRGLCEKLVDTEYHDDHIESVKEFVALQRQGYNAYTVRSYAVAGWRIITAVDHRRHVVAILYIMNRAENYDQLAQDRVTAAYDRLDLFRLPR